MTTTEKSNPSAGGGVLNYWVKAASDAGLQDVASNVEEIKGAVVGANSTIFTAPVNGLNDIRLSLAEVADKVGKRIYGGATDFSITKGHASLSSGATNTIISLAGSGIVDFTIEIGTGGDIYVTIQVDDVERTVPSDVFLSRGGYGYYLFTMEFSKQFKVAVKNLYQNAVSIYYNLSYQYKK